MTRKIRQLDDIRADIDRIDRELVRLINERAGHAMDAGYSKRARDGNDTPLYRPDREAQLLRRIAQINPGPIGDSAMQTIIMEVVSACRAMELPLKVAFLGPSGTYTEAAAFKHFGHGVSTSSQTSIDGVFREVESGACTYGVVPIENSTEGVVSHTLDVFVNSDLSICGEVLVPVNHCLLTNANANAWGDVQCVYSHQQSLAQCRGWLAANLPGVRCEAVSSNAEAARLVADDPAAAAIASKVAGETYGVRIAAANIADIAGNTTRFLVIGNDEIQPSGDDKTSVMFYWSRDVPGGLHGALEVFAKAGLNLNRIESRPSRLQRWNYVFYVDFAGHRDDENVRAALAELEQRTDFCRVIGSFPCAVSEDAP